MEWKVSNLGTKWREFDFVLCKCVVIVVEKFLVVEDSS